MVTYKWRVPGDVKSRYTFVGLLMSTAHMNQNDSSDISGSRGRSECVARHEIKTQRCCWHAEKPQHCRLVLPWWNLQAALRHKHCTDGGYFFSQCHLHKVSFAAVFYKLYAHQLQVQIHPSVSA